MSIPTLHTYCTFTLDGRWYGIPVDGVREVLQHQEMTPVPLAPAPFVDSLTCAGRL